MKKVTYLVDELKSFVKSIPDDVDDRDIITKVIDLASNLRDVIDEEQAKYYVCSYTPINAPKYRYHLPLGKTSLKGAMKRLDKYLNRNDGDIIVRTVPESEYSLYAKCSVLTKCLNADTLSNDRQYQIRAELNEIREKLGFISGFEQVVIDC